jgi:hypothetical protein
MDTVLTDTAQHAPQAFPTALSGRFCGSPRWQLNDVGHVRRGSTGEGWALSKRTLCINASKVLLDRSFRALKRFAVEAF